MLRLLPSLTVIATLAVAPVAFAQSAIAPEPVAPSAGKSLARGAAFTFKARLDEASEASSVFLKVSRAKRVGSDGTLAKDIYFREMKVSGNVFAKKVERYPALSTHFLNRPGRYYWQVYVIDCSDGTDDCNIESSIRTFRIR